MSEFESIVVAVDGPSKAGTTLFTGLIAGEAQMQADLIPNFLSNEEWSQELRDLVRPQLSGNSEAGGFKNITTISAGNMFRAASLYVSLLEVEGQTKESFSPADSDAVYELLALEGIEQVLQHDPNVGSRVSKIAKLPGVYDLCSDIFSGAILADYQADGGGNLVVVDSRDTMRHFQHNNRLGDAADQINPAAILPVYVDNPIQDAAARLPGDTVANLAMICERRFTDATREDFPVHPPADFVTNPKAWAAQFVKDQHPEAVLPLFIWNDRCFTMDHVRQTADTVAKLAHTVGRQLYRLQNAV
jgi:hypothetical protein